MKVIAAQGRRTDGFGLLGIPIVRKQLQPKRATSIVVALVGLLGVGYPVRTHIHGSGYSLRKRNINSSGLV